MSRHYASAYAKLKVVIVAFLEKLRITGGYKMSNRTLTAQSVASYFISRSSELNESNDLTNLKLQKMLFYAQAEHYKHSGAALFSDSIEAWNYGPVVSSVYHWLKGCGAYPITAFDVETDTSGLNSSNESELSSVWDTYSKYSAGFLVQKTHESGSPWDKAFNRPNKVIELDELKAAKLANEWK